MGKRSRLIREGLEAERLMPAADPEEVARMVAGLTDITHVVCACGKPARYLWGINFCCSDCAVKDTFYQTDIERELKRIKEVK